MKNSKKILIDTHIHSSGISKCSRVPANELVNICVEQGLNGIVLTNHYKLASVDTDFKTWRNKYIEEFHITRDYGNKLGLKVFLGVEFTLNSMPQNDFTVYGLSEDFLLSSNPLFELTLNEFIIELDVLKEHTAVNYMVLAAAPQPLVGSEQIQG